MKTALEEIILEPERMSLCIDQTDVPVENWQRIEEIINQQCLIHESDFLLSVQDFNSSEVLAQYLVSYNSGMTLCEDTHNPQANQLPLASLFVHRWTLHVPGHTPASFRSLRDFLAHAQSVSDNTGNEFSVSIAKVLPYEELHKEFVPTQEVDETSSTGEFEAQLSAPFELPSDEPASSSEIAELEASEVNEPTVAFATVEDADDSNTQEPSELGHSTPTPLLEELMSPVPQAAVHDEEYLEPEMPRWKPSRRTVLLGALGVGGLALLGGGTAATLTYLSNDSANKKPEATEITNEVKDLPEGYSKQPSYSLAIPEGARVHATEAAVAIIDNQKITFYDPTNGQEIRSINTHDEIAIIDETHIDGEPSIIWLNTEKSVLKAWNPTIGKDGQIVTVSLPADSAVSRGGQNLLITSSDKAQTLTKTGLHDFKYPLDMTPWSMGKDGLLSIGYDMPVEVTTAQGEIVRSVELSAPNAQERMLQWVAAGNGYTASLWAENISSLSDPKKPVKLLIHSLDNGEITAQVNGTYADLAPSDALIWKFGQNNRLAAYGQYIFSLSTGELTAVVPDNLSPLTPKGIFAIGQSETGATYVFEEKNPGYALANKYILAQTTTHLITQSGNRVVAYQSTLS